MDAVLDIASGHETAYLRVRSYAFKDFGSRKCRALYLLVVRGSL